MDTTLLLVQKWVGVPGGLVAGVTPEEAPRTPPEAAPSIPLVMRLPLVVHRMGGFLWAASVGFSLNLN